MPSAKDVKITFDRVRGGWVVFRDGGKVGVLDAEHFQGLVRNGEAIYEPMPRESWAIHWCSPVLSVPLMKAVLDSLPSEVPPYP